MKRYLFTGIAGVVALVFFVTMSTRHGGLTFGVAGPFLLALLALVITMQVVYRVRLRRVRAVASRLAAEHPDDRFLIGNARWVGAKDRGPDAVPFVTTILQLSSSVLSFWDPDKANHPMVSFPLKGLDLDVMATKPPRLGFVVPDVDGATYLALFRETGMGFVGMDELPGLAHELFPTLLPPTPVPIVNKNEVGS